MLNDLFYICAPAPLQKAVAESLATIPSSYYEDTKAYYQRNRDLLINTLLFFLPSIS
jgi:aminotransferase